VKNVRFDNIKYTKNDQDTELSISGEARGYAALAFQVDIFKKSPNFKNFNIYDLSLGDKGDVKFSFKTTVDDSLISYQRVVDQGGTPTIPAVPVVAPVATSTPAVNSLPKSNI
jgi:hypothetical protein